MAKKQGFSHPMPEKLEKAPEFCYNF